jgi:uncharacterized protein (DUF849 family)
MKGLSQFRLLSYNIPQPTLSIQNWRRFKNTDQKQPVVITVAITGDVAQQARVNVPVSPKHQIEQIVASYEKGARMVHIHVRDDNGKPTWDPKKYQEVMEGCRKYCPDIIVQFSTGNYAPNLEERLKCLELGPEMASLTPGSVNFKASRPGQNTCVQYINSHKDIDSLASKMLEFNIKPDVAIFDLSMIYATADLVRRKLVTLPVRLMYVLGGHMALDSRKEILEFLIKESKFCFGEGKFNWCAVGVGWNNPAVMKWCLELGGNLRTGIEDTLMIKRGIIAKDNSELVANLAELVVNSGKRIATPEESRRILGLIK